MFNILVVEDQAEISHIITRYLEKEGYSFAAARSGFEALDLFERNHYHLVILDVMMPGIDGFEVLQKIRNVSDVPVFMLTAKEQEVDRINGFDLGADDYIVKPFSPRELMRRIRAVFKRVYQQADEIILRTGIFTLYTSSRQLVANGSSINITSTEFHLMHTFMKNTGQILTREQLIQKSFGIDYEGYDRNIDTYIKRLRQKIEPEPKNPTYLVTKYGAGYMFGGGEG